MNGEKRSLPEIQPLPGETIARFQAVGVDENGRKLYQKIEYSQISHGANHQTTISHSKVETIITPHQAENTAKLADQSANSNRLPGADSDLSLETEQELATLAQIASRYENLTPTDVKNRHQETKKCHPEITDLSEYEFILMKIVHYPIGASLIWAGWLAVLVLITSVWLVISSIPIAPLSIGNIELNFASFLGIVVTMIDLLILTFAYISAKIYKFNKMIVTSERIIQFQSQGLFDEQVQSIDLNDIEDVSYHQKGFLAMFLGFGTVRMATVGDETTYQLKFVKSPAKVAKFASTIVQAAKNNRPIPTFESED